MTCQNDVCVPMHEKLAVSPSLHGQITNAVTHRKAISVSKGVCMCISSYSKTHYVLRVSCYYKPGMMVSRAP